MTSARQKFRNAIAAKAVPDEGINLRRQDPRFTPVVRSAARHTAVSEPPKTLECKTTPAVTGTAASEPSVSQSPEPPASRSVEIEDIQELVAHKHGMDRDRLLSGGRKEEFVRPRQTAMYLAFSVLGEGLSEVARRFANCDHTTVRHAVLLVAWKIGERTGPIPVHLTREQAMAMPVDHVLQAEVDRYKVQIVKWCRARESYQIAAKQAGAAEKPTPA